jgi:surface protein
MAQQIPFGFFGGGTPVLGSFMLTRTNVEATEVDTSADVIADGGSPVLDKGICWGSNPNPTIADNFISFGAGGLGVFAIPVSGLLNETTYYFRAYATNLNGTSYSSEIVNNTSYEPLVLEITSTAVSELFSIIRAGSNTADKPSYSVNAFIDWGDGNPIENILSTTNSLASSGLDHSYAVAGTYVVRMSGDCPRIARLSIVQGTSSVNLEEWGTQPWKVLYRAFYSCPNFEITATDVPVFSTAELNLTSSSGVVEMFRGTDLVGQASMNSWDVSGIERLTSMFFVCHNFNVDIGSWDTSSCIDMKRMFQDAQSFNQDISSWDVSNVTDMTEMFSGNGAPTMVFNQNLDLWNVSNVDNFSYMFSNTNLTNSTLAAWTPTASTNFSAMFEDALHIPSGIGSWTFNTGGNISCTNMFKNSTAIIPDITGWNTIGFQSMSSMFNNNSTINQDLSSWDITNLTSLDNFMLGVTTLSTANYDAILIGWEAQAPPTSIIAGFGTTQYTKAPSAAATAHASLLSTYGWTITDGGPTP